MRARMTVALAFLLLAGCSVLRRPPPREVFDTSLAGEADEAASVRISQNPGEDEDPAVVRTRDGLFHVVWWSKQERMVDLFTRTSRDGRSWSEARRITQDPEEDFYPSLIEARDGTLHLAWFRLERRKGRMDIWYARSQDGWHWTRPTRMTSQGHDWAPSLYEDSGGVLWIVWSSRRTKNRELFAASSADGGHRWSPPQQLTESPEEDDFPHVVATRDGERTLAWTRYRGGSPLLDYYRDGTAEIVTATSYDGLEWSAPVTCSPPDPEARYVDILPFAFPDGDGHGLHVSWTSDRPDRKGDILLGDAGAPSAPIRQLTTWPGSDYDAKFVPAAEPGEYLMVWISTRAGSTDIFARLLRP